MSWRRKEVSEADARMAAAHAEAARVLDAIEHPADGEPLTAEVKMWNSDRGGFDRAMVVLHPRGTWELLPTYRP